MARTYVSAVVPATAEDVWQVIRPFDGLPEWHPAIAASSLEKGSPAEVGAVRRLQFAGGDTVVKERLLSLDDAGHSFSYELVEHPFPVRRSVSTLRVLPVVDTNEAFVEWWSESEEDAADAAAVRGLVTELYGSGLSALQQRFSAASRLIGPGHGTRTDPGSYALS